MDGMIVLEKTPIKEYTRLTDIFLVIGISILFIGIFVLIKQTKGETYILLSDIRMKRYLITAGIGITCLIFSAIHFPCFYEETGKYRYRCILEDTVSANYIAENFNIIEIKGKEWIIESKDE